MELVAPQKSPILCNVLSSLFRLVPTTFFNRNKLRFSSSFDSTIKLYILPSRSSRFSPINLCVRTCRPRFYSSQFHNFKKPSIIVSAKFYLRISSIILLTFVSTKVKISLKMQSFRTYNKLHCFSFCNFKLYRATTSPLET